MSKSFGIKEAYHRAKFKAASAVREGASTVERLAGDSARKATSSPQVPLTVRRVAWAVQGAAQQVETRADAAAKNARKDEVAEFHKHLPDGWVDSNDA
jgi:hypothetical protein